VVLLAGQEIGATTWADGNASSGGQGETIDGVGCATSDALHIHNHLSIFLNGVQLAVPSHVGVVPNCDYDLHTHDRSGVVHVESSQVGTKFTLGQVFSVWGMPLANDNVAGLADPSAPIVVYINDNFGTSQTGPRIYAGDLRAIELGPQREITIQIGSPISELPTYDWSGIGPERGF
jgi:hypothetical protein